MLSILLAVIFAVAQASHKGRKEQFSRITKYELLTLNPQDTLDADIKTFSFNIYDQDYNIKLVRNNDMIPAYTQHHSVDPRAHKHQYFTGLQESCHYHGEVLNTEFSSLVAISLCPNRGIRGRIEAFNQTLIIQPAAYYLDLEKDKNDFYNTNDEVLIYRESDFNTSDVTGVHEGVFSKHKHHNVEVQIPENVNQKRRLYTSSNPAQLEEMIVTGPVRVANFQSAYGDRWYQELVAKTTDIINEMSAIYKATNWGGSVGGTNSISVVFAGIHVIFEFTGDYLSLKPSKLYTNCPLSSNAFDDSDECAIDGNAWLGKCKSWTSQYLDFSTFDNIQFVTDMRFAWTRSGGGTSRTLGWGYIGTVCGSSSVTDVSVVPEMGSEMRTMAHELGHNFGMHHDGQSGEGSSCAANAGLMGYSDGTGFSSCSKASMQSYFNSQNGLTCIGSGWPRTFATNYDDGATAEPTTPRPTSRPTPRPTRGPTRSGQTAEPTRAVTPSPTDGAVSTPSPVDSAGCVRISGIDTNYYDGSYNALAEAYNGAAVYELSSRSGQTVYVYKPSTNSYWNGINPAWVWGASVGSNSISVYCAQSDIMSCGGEFIRYTSSGWMTYPSSSIDTECGSGSGSGGDAFACPGYNCVGVAGIDGYSGQFTPDGCYNSERYYVNAGGAVLCFHEYYGRWLITSELCNRYSGYVRGISGQRSDEVVGTGWYVVDTTNSLLYDSGVMVNDCGGGGALNIGDLQCLEDNVYGDSLCMTGNNSLWDEDKTFALYDKLCKNEAPIYHYTVVNTSAGGIVVDGQTLNDESQTVFYLHYHREKRFVDSNETVGQWLISKNEISVNSMAVCQMDNLLDCVASAWKVETTQFGDFGLDGLLLRITDKDLSLSNGECAREENVESGGNGVDNEWIIVLVVLSALIVCFVVGYFVWKKMSASEAGQASFGKHEKTANAQPMDDDVQEIEIEVSMEKNITQTED